MTPPPQYQADARIARLLSSLPGYRQWENRPLDTALRRQLDRMDSQTLMSVVARAMVKLESQQSP